MNMMRAVAGAAALVLLLTTAACSSSGGGSAGHELDVSLAEYSITPNLPQVAGGTVTFQVANAGQQDHEMVVIKSDDAPGALPFENGEASEAGSQGEIPEVAPGQTQTLTLKLAPGHYVLICNLPGHYKGGMHAGFVVS
jgi:uncharacterized cupredoxin-like copper-binding protein